MIWVAVVDDHPIARRGVGQVLVESGRISVVASCASPGEPTGLLAGTDDTPRLDLIVLDLYHDGERPCLEVVTRLTGAAKVLVMSASGRPDDVVGAIRAGASGYVTKQSEPGVSSPPWKRSPPEGSPCLPGSRTSCTPSSVARSRPHRDRRPGARPGFRPGRKRPCASSRAASRTRRWPPGWECAKPRSISDRKQSSILGQSPAILWRNAARGGG
jgi:CheY-like chemotaxis protein